MSQSFAISELLKKRATLAGDIAKLDQQTRRIRAQIVQVDGCLRLFGYKGDLRDITPVKTRAANLLPKGKLQQAVLDIVREAESPLNNRMIAAELIRRKGWASDDDILWDRITLRVKDVMKRVNGANSRKKHD